MEPKTSIRIEHVLSEEDVQIYEISTNRWDLTLSEFMDGVIIPAILAMGYGERTIKEYFGDE